MMFVIFVYFSLIRMLTQSTNFRIFFTKYKCNMYIVYRAYNMNKKSYIGGWELRLIILIIIFTFGIFNVRHNIHMVVVHMQYIILVIWLKSKLWNCHEQIWWLSLYLVLSWRYAMMSQPHNLHSNQNISLLGMLIIIGWIIMFNRHIIQSHNWKIDFSFEKTSKLHDPWILMNFE